MPQKIRKKFLEKGVIYKCKVCDVVIPGVKKKDASYKKHLCNKHRKDYFRMIYNEWGDRLNKYNKENPKRHAEIALASYHRRKNVPEVKAARKARRKREYWLNKRKNSD